MRTDHGCIYQCKNPLAQCPVAGLGFLNWRLSSSQEVAELSRSARIKYRELEEFQKIARRITSILLLSPELNAAYQCTKARAVEWPPLFKKAHVVVLALWVNLKEVVLSIFTRNRKEQNDDKAIRQDSG